jgi:hypothetical protein
MLQSVALDRLRAVSDDQPLQLLPVGLHNKNEVALPSHAHGLGILIIP